MILYTPLQWQQQNINPISNTPYLALTGELWDLYYENFEENWPFYNGTALCLAPTTPIDWKVEWATSGYVNHSMLKTKKQKTSIINFRQGHQMQIEKTMQLLGQSRSGTIQTTYYLIWLSMFFYASA